LKTVDQLRVVAATPRSFSTTLLGNPYMRADFGRLMVKTSNPVMPTTSSPSFSDTIGNAQRPSGGAARNVT